MSSRVLRTDVDYIVIGIEKPVLLSLQITVLVEIVLQAVVRLHIVLQLILIVVLPVLTEGEALEITAQEQPSHVLVAQEHDAIEIIYLAL